MKNWGKKKAQTWVLQWPYLLKYEELEKCYSFLHKLIR